jgi:hypothetical protein
VPSALQHHQDSKYPTRPRTTVPASTAVLHHQSTATETPCSAWVTPNARPRRAIFENSSHSSHPFQEVELISRRTWSMPKELHIHLLAGWSFVPFSFSRKRCLLLAPCRSLSCPCICLLLRHSSQNCRCLFHSYHTPYPPLFICCNERPFLRASASSLIELVSNAPGPLFCSRSARIISRGGVNTLDNLHQTSSSASAVPREGRASCIEPAALVQVILSWICKSCWSYMDFCVSKF